MTLVEIAIALVILAILSGIAVPNFMADMPRRRLAKATRNLVSDLEWTRLQAVSTNRAWRIRFDDPTDSYLIEDSGDNDFATPGGTVVVRTMDLASYGSGIQYGSGAATAAWSAGASLTQQGTIIFDFRGLCAGVSGSTFLTNAEDVYTYAITTSPAGALRVRMFNGMNWMEK